MINYERKYNNPDDPIIIEFGDDVVFKIERCEDTLVIAEKKHEAELVRLFKDLKLPFGDINGFVEKSANSAQARERYVVFAEKLIRNYFNEEDARTILAMKKDKNVDIKKMFYENLIGEIENQKNQYDHMGKLM